jgi:hypothetical protein
MPGKAGVLLKLSLFQILALLIVFMGSFWLTGCTSSQTLHQTYTYKGPTGFYDVTTQTSLTVQWQPQPGPKVNASRPDPIFFKAELIGPFSDVNHLLDWARQNSASGSSNTPPVVASAPLQQTNTWTNRVVTSNIPVSPQIPPGLYDLRYTITVQALNGNAVTRSDAPINIHCPENAPCH